MLHDIGKARIPVLILEKPTELDDKEMGVMRKHPEYGFEALASAIGVKKEVRDMVFYHHEHLDGTGYPYHLKAGQIPDLVRIVTISDIFGALIERRAYKNAMSCKAAYNMLLDMGPKLDPDFGTLDMNDQFVAAVEAIYDAAPDPSRWPHALDLIGEYFGDQDVNLFWSRDDGSRGLIPSTGYNRELAVGYNSTWWKHDIRAIRALERGYFASGNAQTDRDLVTDAEMETHPFFTQFLAPHGMKWLAATSISPDPHVPVAVVINRAASKPAFSDHDLIVLSKLRFHAEKSLRT